MLYYTNVSPLTLYIYYFTFSVPCCFPIQILRLVFAPLLTFLRCLSTYFHSVSRYINPALEHKFKKKRCHRLNPDSEVAPSSVPPLQRDFLILFSSLLDFFFFAFVFAVCLNIEDV